jgi:hypothetical protein
MDSSRNSISTSADGCRRAARTAPSRMQKKKMFDECANLFDRGDPLPWPRRGDERAGRNAARGHGGELVDKCDAEAEEDAPRPRGPRWHGSAADAWGGGGGAGAKRPRAGPSQSDEEEVGACREGGHGDEQAAAVGTGTGRKTQRRHV